MRQACAGCGNQQDSDTDAHFDDVCCCGCVRCIARRSQGREARLSLNHLTAVTQLGIRRHQSGRAVPGALARRRYRGIVAVLLAYHYMACSVTYEGVVGRAGSDSAFARFQLRNATVSLLQ